MTNEEAKDTLKALKAMLKIYPKRKKQKESVKQLDTALNMAIQALSEPSIVRCGECLHYDTTVGYCEKFEMIHSNRHLCEYGERREP